MGNDMRTAATRHGNGNTPMRTKVWWSNGTGWLLTMTTPKEGGYPESDFG